MGSWSVSCGISNIAITSGNDCVILPLKKSRGLDYMKFQPATLPIFGKYNDYGGMEEIIHDKNTKLIEEHFGVTIEEFVEFLVDGKFTYDRREVKPIAAKIKDVEQISEMRFMWIDRKVYEYMAIFNNKWYKGHNDYGTPEFMKLLGFTLDKSAKIGAKDNYDPKRFNKVYRKGDVMFYSDGNTLLSPKNQFVYHFGHGDENSLETYFEVPKDFKYLKELGSHETWRLKSDVDFDDTFGYLLGDKYSLSRSLMSRLDKSYSKSKDLRDKYFEDKNAFGNDICKLYNVYLNLHSMSGQFTPHVLYLTPQCGEYKRHQQILEKFCEINKSYCQEDDE